MLPHYCTNSFPIGFVLHGNIFHFIFKCFSVEQAAFINQTCCLLVAVHLAAASQCAVLLPLTSAVGACFCKQIQSQVKCRAELFLRSSCTSGSLCRLRSLFRTQFQVGSASRGILFSGSDSIWGFVSLFPVVIFAKL